MSLGDRARRLAGQARTYAAGNKDKLERGIEKAGQAADTKTGGKYHGQIANAGQRADEYLEKLANSEAPKAEPESSAEQNAGEDPKPGPTP